MTQNNVFAIGHHRPVYLWAGPGTVRMNQLKFMDAPVDVFVHDEAHTQVGARRMVEEAGFNWAYLMYNWGFPPEVEAGDWEDFHKAAKIYQAEGIKVFGYVQTSNCAFQGSFKDKDWYAQDPKGRPIYYYTGRYMTCWLHPEWLDQLRKMISGIIGAGSDGVFFDNPWLGEAPIHFGGTWSGSAGCHCDRCQRAFRQETGLTIPTRIDLESDKTSRDYLRWRADLVTSTLGELAAYARSLNPGIFISANDYDAVMRPNYITHGIDLRGLAQVQDVVMIEDFALPRWQPGDSQNSAELVNNAITLRTALALVGDTPLSTDPYDKGIGFDDVYPPRRLQSGIVEAAACGATMVVKGTEYVDSQGVFTLLTAKKYAPERAAANDIHHWLSAHADLYRERRNAARVGLLYPKEGMHFQWDQLAPRYFGVCQTLTNAGIPWRVVTAGGDWDGLETLFTLEKADHPTPSPHIIYVPDLPGWSLPKPSYLARHRGLLDLLSGFLSWYYRAYFRYRWARRITDGLGITQWFLQSPHFRMPADEDQSTILGALGELPAPRVESTEAPVLIEVWQRGGERQIHLVNYGPNPQTVQVTIGQSAMGEIISPYHETVEFTGKKVELDLGIYTVLCYTAPS